MESKLVLIAGGSGCGKSALAQSLRMKYPNTFALLHLDDYYMRASSAMKLQNGAANWEHPDSLDFDHVVFDVCTLLEGNSVTVSTKSEFYNPGYLPTLHNKISQVVEPRPIVLLEGYLTLHTPALRELSELSMYLDIPIEDSLVRRSENKLVPSRWYVQDVLIPAHYEFVERTKKYADVNINVQSLSREEVMKFVEKLLRSSFPIF